MTVCAVVSVTENVATPDPLVVVDAGEIEELPAPWPSETVWPLRVWPSPSLAVTVMVDDELPLAITELGDELTVDAAASTAPTVNDTVTVWVTATESVVSVAV